jgi:peptide/nickel transport system substrate-binding protein
MRADLVYEVRPRSSEQEVPVSRTAFAVLAASTAIMATAIGAAGSLAGGSAPLGTVTVRLGQDYQSLNPYVDAGRAQPWAAVSPGYDRLVTWGPNGAKGSYVPYLATSWKQTPRSITFKLKRNAKCSDGHVLTPADVAAAVQEFIEVPKRTGNAQSNSIGGFGPGQFSTSSNAKAGTFTFTSTKPYRNFLSQFAAFPIVCPAGIAALKQDQNALNEKVYGSGPYTLTSATHNDKVVWQLRANWSWGRPTRARRRCRRRSSTRSSRTRRPRRT